jgi:NADH-quinone oxidoreductase subunit J
MSVIEIMFWFLSVMALGAAVMVVASKSPVYSILFLILTFFAISGHYILLNAQFLAIVNIIVYAGAIMVLFLFVVMLMNLNAESEPHQKNKWLLYIGGISGGSLYHLLSSAVHALLLAVPCTHLCICLIPQAARDYEELIRLSSHEMQYL